MIVFIIYDVNLSETVIKTASGVYLDEKAKYNND